MPDNEQVKRERAGQKRHAQKQIGENPETRDRNAQIQTIETQSGSLKGQMPSDQIQGTVARLAKTPRDQFDPQREQAILASFADPDTARKASGELKKMGIDTVQIDRVSPYPGQPTQKLTNPLTGKIPSLGDLALGMDPSSRNAGVLMAADASASGYATTADDVSGEDILLTVVCPKDQVEQAVQVIKSFGGNT